MSSRTTVRCAIYTRKSSEEGLEQAFNSLDAQHDAAVAYILSQQHEGWKLVAQRYDDGGISGGTMDRPALQRLLKDIDAGRIDMVVVYKIDRLTRSLADFAKLVERFEKANCSFVSVTQAFNTSTSMGRLTLNVLLSFAQFEREVTAERIRDKIAASKKKGMWMGGTAPLGYDPHPDPQVRSLQINAAEAETVRRLFALYDELGCVRLVARQATKEGLRSKIRTSRDGSTTGGRSFTRGQLYYLLHNPTYIGRIRHRHQSYEGLHKAIVDIELWDRVQKKLAQNAAHANEAATARERSFVETSHLAGKLRDETGDRLTPSHAVKNGKRHRYYVSHRLVVAGRNSSEKLGWRLPARQLERQIAALIAERLTATASQHRLLRQPLAADGLRLIECARAIEAKIDKEGISAAVPLIDHCTIAPGTLTVALDRPHLAVELKVEADLLADEALTLSCGFQLRRRGVEAKFISGIKLTEPDQKLIDVLAKAHGWLDRVLKGETIADIARRDGHAKYYVGSRLQLAFLSPKLQQQIVEGTQPSTMTIQSLVQKDLPLNWTEQEEMFLKSAYAAL